MSTRGHWVFAAGTRLGAALGASAAISGIAHALKGPLSVEIARGAMLAVWGAAGLSFVLARGWAIERRREMVGGWVLVTALFVTSSLAAAGELVLPHELLGWQMFAVLLGSFAFLLGSQRSFLMLGFAATAILMVALVLEPRHELAMLHLFGLALQLGLLSRHERAARFPSSRPSVASPLLASAALPALFLATYATLPAAEPAAPAELGAAWAKRLGLTPPDPTKKQVAPGAGSPGRTGAGSAIRPTPGALDPRAATRDAPLELDRDLKFGDANTPHAERARPVFYCRLRDAAGAPVELDPAQAYWPLGYVARYERRAWYADTTTDEELDADATGWVELDPARDIVAGAIVEQRYVMRPVTDRALPTLGRTLQVQLPRVRRNEDGAIARVDREVGPARYAARSVLADVDPDVLARAGFTRLDPRYHHVPAEVRRSVDFQRWSSEVGVHATAAGRVARALELLHTCRYDLAPGFPGDVDPTVAFLERRRGYCQHFCSAFAMLVRDAGLPARLAVGFAQGEWHGEGEYYVLRRLHAHCWVEVFFAELGWVRYDPTQEALEDFSVPGEPPPVAPRDPRPDPIPRPIPPRPDPPRPDPPDPEPPKPDPQPDPKPPVEPPKPKPPKPDKPRVPEPKEEPVRQAGQFDMLWSDTPDLRGQKAPAVDAPPEDEREPTKSDEPPAFPLWEATRAHLPWVGGLVSLLLAVVAMLTTRPRRRPTRLPVRPRSLAVPDSRLGPPARYELEGTVERRVVDCFRRLEAYLAGRDGARRAGQTAHELVVGLGPSVRDRAGELVRLFERARYGAAPLLEADARTADELVTAITRM